MGRALLVIDMLTDFVAPDGALVVPGNQGILVRVAEEIADARSCGEPVVYICDRHQPDDPEFERMGWPPHAVDGTPGAAVAFELAPQAEDTVVAKTTYSGIYGTRLEAELKARAVDTVRLTGCATNICVLYTAADAAMRGYDVEVVRDAVAGLTAEDHTFALSQMVNVLGARLVGRETRSCTGNGMAR